MEDNSKSAPVAAGPPVNGKKDPDQAESGEFTDASKTSTSESRNGSQGDERLRSQDPDDPSTDFSSLPTKIPVKSSSNDSVGASNVEIVANVSSPAEALQCQNLPSTENIDRIVFSNVGKVEIFQKPSVGKSATVSLSPSGESATVPTEESQPKKLELTCLQRVEYQDIRGYQIYEDSEVGNHRPPPPPPPPPPPIYSGPSSPPFLGSGYVPLHLPQYPDSQKHVKSLTDPQSVMELITNVTVEKVEPHFKGMRPEELIRGRNHFIRLQINSLLLANAIRAVVSYLPGCSLPWGRLSFEEPFCLLVWYRKELQEYKSNHPATHSEEYREECNKHIDVLLDFLQERFMSEFERHEKNPPMCTFEYAWMLVKPGTDLYTIPAPNADNTPRSVFVCEGVSGGPVKTRLEPYQVKFWDLQSDGHSIQRSPSTNTIQPFDGEKEIRSLSVYPTAFINAEEWGSLQERLIARGKKYFEYTSISHKFFHGHTLEYPRRAVTSRVIIDTAGFYGWNNNPSLGFKRMNPHEKNSRVRGCNCYSCDGARRGMEKLQFAEYEYIALKSVHTTGKLSDHQYLICSPRIWGFSLKHMDWDTLDMDAIQDISFSHEVINDLVLDPEDNKPLLKALAKRYAQMPHDVDVVATVKNGVTVVETNPDKKIWAGDFVEGKGEGQIILLHGPPGVGKTCTAESVAEFTERPLISLTCSHIGVDPEKVEGKLRLWMVKARRWGAILLIDEADVYLEERTAHDFDRNSLVAIFLNCLEYYQGILFLTTNRVGAFDEAFASRIHISIWYPGFDDSKRIKIWKTMIRRLERERKDIKVPWDLTKYIERDEDLKAVEWNGREIRNAFQTAVALAEYQATEEGSSEVELKCEYLDQVVKMSKRFKEYLSTLPDGNTAKKMWKYGMRNDDFGGEKGVRR